MPSPRRRTDAAFDRLCEAMWQPLVLTMFAVCGDLAIARESVRRAFVDAWHHWPRAQWQGPETYVRTSALRHAAWRIRTRAFHRSQRVTRDQQATLDALDQLTAPARRAVVLAVLSGLDVATIARETGEPETRTAALITAGREGVADRLGIPVEMVAARLQGLAGAARTERPPASSLRALGVRRRQAWLGGGVVAAVVVTVLAGLYVRAGSAVVERLPPALGPEVTAGLLLTPDGLAPLGQPARWTVQSAGRTTSTGPCQRSTSADPDRLRTYTRSFQLASKRTVGQAIELSRTERQARAAYRTVLGWFDACSADKLQPVTSYDVAGVGDDARVIRLRQQGDRINTYAVAVARTGHILTWATVLTQGPQGPRTSALVSTLANAVTRACRSKAAGGCRNKPVATEAPASASVQQAGMLDVADLPAVPGVNQPWRGTAAAAVPNSGAGNPAATTCDRTDFAAAGATSALSRTYLAPGADVPTRFGVSETLGRFGSPVQSRGLVAQIADRLNSCQSRDPGAKVGPTAVQATGPHGSSWYLWRVTSDVSAQRSVTFWMGVARYGVNVVQVSFVPGNGNQDLSQAAFTALVERSRDRLFELAGNGGQV